MSSFSTTSCFVHLKRHGHRYTRRAAHCVVADGCWRPTLQTQTRFLLGQGSVHCRTLAATLQRLSCRWMLRHIYCSPFPKLALLASRGDFSRLCTSSNNFILFVDSFVNCLKPEICSLPPQLVTWREAQPGGWGRFSLLREVADTGSSAFSSYLLP